MADGNSKTKRCVIVTDLEGGKLHFHEPVAAPAGSKAKWAPGAVIFTANCDGYPPEMQRIAMITTGFRNKLMDSYADPSADILSSLTDVDTSLREGSWSARGESSEKTTLFILAYAAHKNLSVEEVKGKVNAIESGDDEAAKAKLALWRKDGAIAAKMAEIQVARAQERLAAAKSAASAAEEMADL